MKWVCFGWVIVCALFITQGCRKFSPSWGGTWKLNSAKSSFKGQVLTISVSADGEYRFDESSSRTIRCDEKDQQPIGNSGTLVCVKCSATALEIIHRENGVETRATRYEVSNDGKLLTTTVTVHGLSGPVIASKITFSRLSGSDGLTGQWRGTSYLEQQGEMTLRLDDQVVHIDYPATGEHLDAPLNGADAAMRGLNVPDGTTQSVRPTGQREFLTMTKRNGKVLNQGSLKLSGNGRTITESWWTPNQPFDKNTLVYDKQ